MELECKKAGVRKLAYKDRKGTYQAVIMCIYCMPLPRKQKSCNGTVYGGQKNGGRV